MFSAEPQMKRKRESKMADDDNHLSHVLSITNNAIKYLKEKDVQNREDVNEHLKIENEQLKRKMKHVRKMFEMSDMKIKLTDISKKEDENQKLKDQIKSLELKLKIQEDEHQKFKKRTEIQLLSINESVKKFFQMKRK